MSRQNLNHHRLFTGDMGQLIPVGLVEVLPGDTFRHSAQAFVRLSPMAAPVMHPMSVRLHHWFVPHRLSWPDNYAVSFEDFITGGPDNNDTNPVPTLTTTGTPLDLLDYLGLPRVSNIEVSSLPVRAFNLIFNEFYRDQDLVAARADEDVTLPNVAWEKDYFSTARPWPQKGPDITLPLGTSAPVRGIQKLDQTYAGSNTTGYESGGTGTVTYGSAARISDLNTGEEFRVEEDPNNTGFPNIWADLSEATASTVLAIRRAFALQRFSENRARYGSRYTEYLRLGFRVRSPDARLQRPEYLGGGSTRVSTSEVLQTAPESTGRAYGVGDLYGHGVAMNRANSYRARFLENGYVLSLLSVRPKAMYTNGIERTWLRQTKEDFFQPELQFIGQQQVKEQEVYADGTNKDNVFGYSDRYQEYRYQRSLVTGEFRSLLDYWHLGRQFQAAPALNETFITCTPTKRVFNEQTANSLWCAVQHRLSASRRIARTAVGRTF